MKEEITQTKVFPITTLDLRKLAIEYDRFNGEWADNHFEGLDFYNWVMEKYDPDYKAEDADEWSEEVYK